MGGSSVKLGEIFASLFDDPQISEAEPEALATDVVSDLLPWRVYDPDAELYYSSGTTGFMLEVLPHSSGDDLAENLTAVVQNRAPPNATIQIMNWTSHNIDVRLSDWGRHRLRYGPLVSEMAYERMAYLRRVNQEHENIYNAIAAQDFEAARAAMRTHLSNSRDRHRRSEAGSR